MAGSLNVHTPSSSELRRACGKYILHSNSFALGFNIIIVRTQDALFNKVIEWRWQLYVLVVNFSLHLVL